MRLWRGWQPSRGGCFYGRGWCALAMPQTSSMPPEQPGVFKPGTGTTAHLALPAQVGYHPESKFSVFHTVSINPSFKQLLGSNSKGKSRQLTYNFLMIWNNIAEPNLSYPCLNSANRTPRPSFSVPACVLRPAPYLISLYCTRCLLTSKVSFTFLNTLIKILEAAWCKQ